MTIPVSRRQRIIEWFKAKLEGITVENGFSTDAGLALYLGFVPQLGPDDAVSAAAIVIGDDTVKWQGDKAFITLPITISACAATSASDPFGAMESLLADIKRAIEVTDKRLGGLLPQDFMRGTTRTFGRESGSTTIGTSLNYFVGYNECWGQPEA